MGEEPVRHVPDDERRARLARRGQLGAAGRSDRSPADVAGAIALLHGTDPSTVHLQLHARCEHDRAGIDAFLHDERALLRHTCLRRTVHVMPRDVAPLAHGAYNGPLVEKLRGQLVGWLATADDARVAGLDEQEREAWLRALEDEVVDHLAVHGPVGGTGLADAIDGLRLVVEPMPGKAYSRPIRLTSKVLEVVAADARITRARPTGDLTSAAWDWVAMEDWWPNGLAAFEEAVPDEPLVELMQRFLATYGPATTTDAGWWTGLGKTKVRRAFAALGAARVTVDGPDDEAWLLADDLEPEPALDDHHAALLPGLDAVAMAHKLRDWWLGDHVEALYDRNGNAGPTAWVEGRAVGAWDQRDDGSVVVGLLEDVDAEAEQALAAEAARTSAWLGEVRVKPRYPVPLQKALHANSAPVGVRVIA